MDMTLCACINQVGMLFGNMPSLQVNKTMLLFWLLAKVKTWGGKVTVEHFIPPNPWARPGQTSLIKSGALYAPCVRKDKGHLLR